MAAVLQAPQAQATDPEAGRLLPLENGDHLTRAEFERRYAAMPQLHKAELIEGSVQMPSPIRIEHQKADGAIIFWLGAYVAATPCIQFGGDGSVRLDADNEVQPDALLRIEEACGGQSRVGADGFVEGAPELVVEIAGSSASCDLHTKLSVYRRNGVREYIVWRVYDGVIDWFVLDEARYVAQTPDKQGVLCSIVFPGLHLPTAAMLEGRLADVVAAVQQAVQTPEHAAFLAQLQSRHEDAADSAATQ